MSASVPVTPVTNVARVTLGCGSFHALWADHFARSFPPHFHDTYAIGVIESGRLRLRTSRGEWLGGRGTILAFAPGEVHSAEPLGAEGWRYRMIYPDLELLREAGVVGRASGQPWFSAPVISDPRLGAALARAHGPLMDGGAAAAVEERLVGALRMLARRYAVPVAPPAGRRAGDRRVIEDATAWLEARCSEPVRLEALATACGQDKYRLVRLFHRELGVPPYAYLLQLRVNRAQHLLHHGGSVSDVAFACGFSDQSHFTRVFRRAVGVPPGQYRRAVLLPSTPAAATGTPAASAAPTTAA